MNPIEFKNKQKNILNKFIKKYNTLLLTEYLQQFELTNFFSTSDLYQLKEIYHDKLNTYFHFLGGEHEKSWILEFLIPMQQYRLNLTLNNK